MVESESDLLRRCARGDEDAYRELVARIEKPLINFIRRYVNEAALAEDIFQETFVRVVRTLGTFKPEASLSTWIFTIARNLCLDKIKMTKRHREVSMDASGKDGKGNVIDFREALKALTPDPDVTAETGEERKRLMKAVALLSAPKREALVMRQFAGLSYQEIAVIVKAPVGTVKFRVHEAMQELMKLMGAVGESGRQADAV
jgi:RNA polymerase sigma-70 factor (ECF subfamily)